MNALARVETRGRTLVKAVESYAVTARTVASEWTNASGQVFGRTVARALTGRGAGFRRGSVQVTGGGIAGGAAEKRKVDALMESVCVCVCVFCRRVTMRLGCSASPLSSSDETGRKCRAAIWFLSSRNRSGAGVQQMTPEQARCDKQMGKVSLT